MAIKEEKGKVKGKEPLSACPQWHITSSKASP